MTAYMPPFTHLVNLQDGTIPTAPLVQQRRLSDMRGLYADPAAEYALMSANPLIYEVYEAAQNPKEAGPPALLDDGHPPRQGRRRVFHDQGALPRQGGVRRAVLRAAG
ncbi:MAG: hypothetical protein M5U29_07945 [Anaerolineae bacterium]|nr:hypothetical protein [Anaerolineae bacterium]